MAQPSAWQMASRCESESGGAAWIPYTSREMARVASVGCAREHAGSPRGSDSSVKERTSLSVSLSVGSCTLDDVAVQVSVVL